MFLSGVGQIYSDFSNQLRWAPSAGIYDIFHQKFDGGQGHVMDNQDSEMGSPDPSSSHCTTTGNPLAPRPEQQLSLDCSPWAEKVRLSGWTSGRVHGWVRKEEGTLQSAGLANPTPVTKNVVEVIVSQLPIRQARPKSHRGCWMEEEMSKQEVSQRKKEMALAKERIKGH